MYRSGRSRGTDALGREYESLRRDRRRHVDSVVEEACKRGTSVVRTAGDAEYYAYPSPGGGISWGVNEGPHGINTKRGVKP